MLEYLLSDSNNIKKLLHCITKYIKSNNIDSKKTNDIPDLKGLGEVAWNFISALYKLG